MKNHRCSLKNRNSNLNEVDDRWEPASVCGRGGTRPLTRVDVHGRAPEAVALVGGGRHHDGVLHAAVGALQLASAGGAVAGDERLVAALGRHHVLCGPRRILPAHQDPVAAAFVVHRDVLQRTRGCGAEQRYVTFRFANDFNQVSTSATIWGQMHTCKFCRSVDPCSVETHAFIEVSEV